MDESVARVGIIGGVVNKGGVNEKGGWSKRGCGRIFQASILISYTLRVMSPQSLALLQKVDDMCIKLDGLKKRGLPTHFYAIVLYYETAKKPLACLRLKERASIVQD